MLKCCRVCLGKNVSQIARFDDMPIWLWPSRMNAMTPRNQLVVFLCKECDHIQLQNFDDNFIESLYDGDYMNLDSSEINRIRANYIRAKNQLENSRVLDVGGGTNSSYEFFKESHYSILDPQEPTDDQVVHIKGLISNSYLAEQAFDYIFAFHVFEHLENPRQDLVKLSRSLKHGGRIFVEIPESKYYAKNIPYYLYFHQHINLFTDETLDKLFSLEGFHKIESSLNDGRLLVTYEKSAKDQPKISSPCIRLVNPMMEINQVFFEKIEREILLDLESLGPGEVVFLGAGGSTTLLLYHFPQLSRKVNVFMDNDIRKIGLYFPGTTKKIEQMTRDPESKKIYLTLGEGIFIKWGNIKPKKYLDLKSYFGREVR